MKKVLKNKHIVWTNFSFVFGEEHYFEYYFRTILSIVFDKIMLKVPAITEEFMQTRTFVTNKNISEVVNVSSMCYIMHYFTQTKQKQSKLN